ncbi:unnamed protein product [Protopolystoma xenopodis]|uniref:Uncharacterized protein n=1 Tax=Protopolystoma xenopodis TaxID=117903 RepID=A0A448WEJ7_9PLAT|nr:unnamed protein product [Protopolystoma xenopodis]
MRHRGQPTSINRKETATIPKATSSWSSYLHICVGFQSIYFLFSFYNKVLLSNEDEVDCCFEHREAATLYWIISSSHARNVFKLIQPTASDLDSPLSNQTVQDGLVQVRTLDSRTCLAKLIVQSHACTTRIRIQCLIGIAGADVNLTAKTVDVFVMGELNSEQYKHHPAFINYPIYFPGIEDIQITLPSGRPVPPDMVNITKFHYPYSEIHLVNKSLGLVVILAPEIGEIGEYTFWVRRPQPNSWKTKQEQSNIEIPWADIRVNLTAQTVFFASRGVNSTKLCIVIGVYLLLLSLGYSGIVYKSRQRMLFEADNETRLDRLGKCHRVQAPKSLGSQADIIVKSRRSYLSPRWRQEIIYLLMIDHFYTLLKPKYQEYLESE